MDQLLVLVVVVPLLAAAAISAAGPLLGRARRVLDAVAIGVAASVAVMLLIIMVRTVGADQVYWFGGFRPARGIAIGIDFEASPLSAGLASLAAVLVTAGMTFSWRYFERVATYYHALMLIFLAGMTGFCLTGDIFDLFVWFEVMGVAAYALTAYRPEERGSLQGALTFAITNSIGAYLSLSGIGLIYGRTGALNMAQIGAYIGRHPPDGLVAVAFLLIISGLLIKSAIVPFHFWLADAHAVAPTPVCVLFSGVMVELGLYGIARVYWSMFGQALGHRSAVSHLFLALGVLTAVVGALFCFRERHIKRMLAFSTISHAGVFLAGIALLTPLGLAGTAVYVAAHGLVKAALFLCVGIVLHRLGSVNETWLHGRGRRLRATGVVFTLAAFGLADLPPFGTFLGQGYIDDSAWAHGLPWLTPVFVLCTILTGGATLRVAGGVFYGLGDAPSEDAEMAKMAAEETSETEFGQAADPAHHDHPARPARRLRRRARPHHPARPGGPGGGDPASGPGRIQRHRPGRRAHRSPSRHRGGGTRRPHRLRRADRDRLGGRRDGPCLPRPVLAPPAAAATWLRTRHRTDRAGPALPERCRERLRDLDRPGHGLHRRDARPDHPVSDVLIR